MIWKKRKEIVLDCFTYDRGVYDFASIDYLKNAIPSWWKNLPSYNNQNNFYGHNSMKGCPGFIDNFKNGFYIPLWSDLKIGIDNKNFQCIFSAVSYPHKKEATSIVCHLPGL